MQPRLLNAARPGMPARPATAAPARPKTPPDTLSGLVDLAPDLPALPTVALATHRETGKPGATAASVGALVATDPALTARVLRLANSAFYGVARQVSAVPDAVMVLGMKGVRNLCLLAGTYPWLQAGLPAYGFAPGALLSHSLAAALGARSIAERAGLDADAAFTAGLLHDLGKVALAMWFKPADGPIRSRDDEKRVLRFDHAQVGGELARRWNLPLPLVGAISCHHMPCEGLEDAVHLGDVLAHLVEGTEPPEADADALLRCKTTPEELITMAEELKPEYERLKKMTEACA